MREKEAQWPQVLIEWELLAKDICLKKWLIEAIEEEIDAIENCEPHELEDFYGYGLRKYVDKLEDLQLESERCQWDPLSDPRFTNHFSQQVITLIRLVDLTKRSGELVQSGSYLKQLLYHQAWTRLKEVEEKRQLETGKITTALYETEERRRLATTNVISTIDKHYRDILIEEWTRKAQQRALEDPER